MKVTIEQSKLVDVINWVSRSLSSRPIQTALLGIVLEADQNKIYLFILRCSTVCFNKNVATIDEIVKSITVRGAK